ncbi:MAG: hypothetical protein EBY26_00180 [Microbacteriaceae bacterium]|nr:hypothetical protein [Microbacteriaceae bacterium]
MTFRIPFAVLIVSDAPSTPFNRHTLVTEHGVWTRIDNGSRGRGNMFTKAKTMDFFDRDERLIGEPVAISLTDNDWDAWVTNQSITPIAQKLKIAFTSESNSEVGLEDSAKVAYEAAVNAFANAMVTELASMVNDKRRKNPVVIAAPSAIRISPMPAPAAAPATPATQSSVGGSLSYVPNAGIAKSYINRVLTGGMTDFDFLDKAMRLGLNIELVGDCGSGKSTVGVMFAAARQYRLVQINGDASLDRAPIIGSMVLSNGNMEWVDGFLTEAVRHGGVLILDEVNLIDKKIMSALHGLLADRVLTIISGGYKEVVVAHPDLLIIATANPDYAGTQRHNEATKDRWVTLEWDYDPKVEAKLIPSKALRECITKLRDRRKAAAIDTPIGTRLAKRFVEMVNEFGWDMALEVFLNRFSIDERPVVRDTFKTYSVNIQRELGVIEPEVSSAPEALPDEPELAPWEQELINQ